MPPRKCARVSHLSLSKALARMLRGPFTAADLEEETGLARPTIYELLRTMLQERVVRALGKVVGPSGRCNVQQFQLAA